MRKNSSDQANNASTKSALCFIKIHKCSEVTRYLLAGCTSAHTHNYQCALYIILHILQESDAAMLLPFRVVMVTFHLLPTRLLLIITVHSNNRCCYFSVLKVKSTNQWTLSQVMWSFHKDTELYTIGGGEERIIIRKILSCMILYNSFYGDSATSNLILL